MEAIDPFAVRFSQGSIRGRFRDGRTIDEMAHDLVVGALDRADIPPIRVVERDGEIFTLDNRRLEAFRRAGMDVPYRLATPDEVRRESWKFTTTNGGASIRVRDDVND